MTKIEIRRWDNNEIIVCGEYESIKDCLEKNKRKSFYRANLSGADLSRADLSKIPQLNTYTVNEYIEKFKIEKKVNIFLSLKE